MIYDVYDDEKYMQYRRLKDLSVVKYGIPRIVSKHYIGGDAF
jgi:hypothetical protein